MEVFIILFIICCGIGTMILSLFPCFQNLSIIKDFLAFLAGGGLTSYLICKFVVPKAVFTYRNNKLEVAKNPIASPDREKVFKNAEEQEKEKKKYIKEHLYGFLIVWIYQYLLDTNEYSFYCRDFIHYLYNGTSNNDKTNEIIKKRLSLDFSEDEIDLLKELAKREK